MIESGTIEGAIMTDNSTVWYASYGSNICEGRFLCYILGGKWKWGGSCSQGCSEKSPPTDSKPMTIKHELYFAKKSTAWEGGGVAFIKKKKEHDTSKYTYGRMWRITREQFDCVKKQEGPAWYGKDIKLGKEGNEPIYTFTNPITLRSSAKPSIGYLKTISLGLKETYDMCDEQIVKYLASKFGVKENFKEETLLDMLQSLNSDLRTE